MDSVQTLHDFALNLLNDPTALAAFGTDPQGCLAAAGLGDVSAADVHEVIPLVLDYVPVDSLPAVGGLPVVGDLSPIGTDATGIQGAIDQLTALTAGLGLPAVGDLPGAGDLVGELPGVGGLGLPGLGGLGHSVTSVTDVTNTVASVTALAGDTTSSLGLGGDLAQSIDAGALGGLGSAVTGAVESGNVVGQVDDVVTGVTGHVAAPVHAGDLTGAVTGAVTGATDVTNHIGDFTGTLKNVGDLDVKHVGGDLTSTVQHSVGDITHNTVTTVTGAAGVDHNGVGEIGSSNGVDAVHDVVSGVTDNLSHNALGNIHVGDLGHNDIHLGH
ncbi:IniB N-terminal domain-containing protein [Amycolatopsis sp. NPDC051045]|uniref:IniB N-terminal domain-containing protein n=1 Tax=Amycolatopsis sp. NPDC051045 TaxID=3156922 RepID=UPI0034194C50